MMARRYGVADAPQLPANCVFDGKGVTLPAWYAVPGEPNGAMLLHHISQSHPAELRPYLAQMEVSKERIPFLTNLRERQKEVIPVREGGPPVAS
jgi:hypothetical protein